MNASRTGATAQTSRTGVRRLWLYAAPVLLVAVALTQLYLAHARDLTPWKGGGFGMFASIDGPGHRVMQVTLVDAHGARWVADIDALEGATAGGGSPVRRAIDMPDDRGLQRVIDAVTTIDWVPGPTDPVPIATIPGRPPAGTEAPEQSDFIEVIEVRVAVMRLTFDRDTETVRAEVISERREDAS